MKLNPSGAPVETKVVSGATYGSVTLFAVWILTTYVFHGHIPSDLSTLLPGLTGVVAGTGAAWLSRHTPRTAPAAADTVPAQADPELTAEVSALIGDVRAMMSRPPAQAVPAPQPVPETPPAAP